MALFAVCSPFGPIPSLDAAQKDLTFKSKHRLNMNVISMDVRAKVILGYSEKEMADLRFYHILHPSDLHYAANGHQQLLKSNSLGLLVYRWLSKSGKWIWLQSSLKVTYKGSKQECIICTHRQLSEDEGSELMAKRNAEYKLPFPLLEPETSLSDEMEGFAQETKKTKNKGQLKDYLQASRKRKTPYREIGYSSYSPFTQLAPFQGHSSFFCSNANSYFTATAALHFGDTNEAYRQSFSSTTTQSSYYGYGVDGATPYQPIGFSYPSPNGTSAVDPNSSATAAAAAAAYCNSGSNPHYASHVDLLRVKLDSAVLPTMPPSPHDLCDPSSSASAAYRYSRDDYCGRGQSSIPVSVVRNSVWKQSDLAYPNHHHHHHHHHQQQATATPDVC